MGTTWRIYHSGSLPQEIADQMALLVEADEQRWSRFRESSELMKLNRCAGIPVEASEETAELLAECDRWVKETDGVFNPLIGRALRSWGYEVSKFERAPGTASRPAAAPVQREPLVFDRSRRIVLVPEGTELDLGGIAKTWSVARTALALLAVADDPVLLVDAGGDMVAARGDHVVIVEGADGPDAPAIAHVRVPESWGVATSGWSRRHWTNEDGSEAMHIIDPMTGEPASRVQATVVAAEPVRAEVTAKLLVLRPDLIDHVPVAALVATPDGVRTSRSWADVVTDADAD
jgi:thiamine biosynthesis lipoprotein